MKLKKKSDAKNCCNYAKNLNKVVLPKIMQLKDAYGVANNVDRDKTDRSAEAVYSGESTLFAHQSYSI